MDNTTTVSDETTITGTNADSNDQLIVVKQQIVMIYQIKPSLVIYVTYYLPLKLPVTHNFQVTYITSYTRLPHMILHMNLPLLIGVPMVA